MSLRRDSHLGQRVNEELYNNVRVYDGATSRIWKTDADAEEEEKQASES